MSDDFEQLTPNEELHYLKRNYIASQYRIASVAYALVICLVGIVLITIEPFKACTKCGRDVKILVDLFFIYMYTVSIFWIIVMQALIIMAKRQHKIAIKHPTGMNRRLSTTYKIQAEQLSKLKKEKAKKKPGLLEQIEKKALLGNFLSRNKSPPTMSDLPPNSVVSEMSESVGGGQATTSMHPNVAINMAANQVHHMTSSDSDFNSRFNLNAAIAANNNKFYFTYDYENGTGELYMRVGTAIFAVCSLIDRSLSLIQMFESYFENHYAALTSECRLTFVLSTTKIVCSFLFIFMQTFFIFKYANIVINYGKNSAVIGLMHIMCTNFCVFVRTVILETVAEIRHHYYEHHLNESTAAASHHKLDGYHSSTAAPVTTGTRHTKSFVKSVYIMTSNFPIFDESDHEYTNHTNVSFLTDGKLGCINRYLVSTDVSIGVQEAQERLGPYLYPCVIEYSLMCMTVFYILWASIEQRYNAKNNLGGWVKTRASSLAVPTFGVTHSSTNVAAQTSGAASNSHQQQQPPGLGHIEVHQSVGHNMNSLGKMPIIKTHIYEKNPSLKTVIQSINNPTTSSPSGSAMAAAALVTASSSSQHLNPRRPSYRYSLSFEKRYANQFVIDCGKSTTGLFFGILTLLVTLISLITFFIYKGADKERAIKLSEVTELTLVLLSLFVNIVTIIKLKMVKFDHKISYSMGYNETLTLIGLAGVYMFSFYSIIAILEKGLENEIEKLSFSIQVTTLVETTLQGIFIINGLKMFTRDSHIKKSKPGRSFVTLLILINVSLWMSDTFSIKKYDMNQVQLDYYNVVFWSIASSISAPLAIFYRFHVSVCLSDMWKTLYE